MRSIQRVMIGLLVALLSACGADSDGQQSAQRGSGEVAVVTAEVVSQAMVDEIQALGTAGANESIEIQARIASVVERIAFTEGQDVERGALLVELENGEIEAGLALAVASLAESQSLYDRSKSLASTQAISASNLDQLLAQVRVNEAQVEAAKARLENTIIRAPFSGRVGLRRVSPGGSVNTQTIITTLDDTRRIKLDFSVPEAFLTTVTVGMPIEGRSIVYPGRVFGGKVASIDTRLDAVSRAVRVRALIDNADDALKPGMFMTVRLQRDEGEVLVAPEQALVPEGANQYVFVVKDGHVEQRIVEIGRRTPGFVVIRNGLSAGERVIKEGTSKVRDGSSVKELNDADL